jgi:hypothetical protein
LSNHAAGSASGSKVAWRSVILRITGVYDCRGPTHVGRVTVDGYQEILGVHVTSAEAGAGSPEAFPACVG